MRERRLATIGLPVGVGDEGDGRVEGEMPGQSAKPLRVERQQVLEEQDRKEQSKTCGIEDQ